jgi:hypothetical protein
MADDTPQKELLQEMARLFKRFGKAAILRQSKTEMSGTNWSNRNRPKSGNLSKSLHGLPTSGATFRNVTGS